MKERTKLNKGWKELENSGLDKPYGISDVELEAWEAWEEDQKTNPQSVNPHVFVYGYKIAKKELSKQPEKQVTITDEEILKEARTQFIEGYQDIFVTGAEFVRQWFRDKYLNK